MDNNSIKKGSNMSQKFYTYLQEPTKKTRLSRFEAYCYMVDKACGYYQTPSVNPKFVPEIGFGQLFTTKSELAEEWHWHRATVREFLDRLVELEYLIKEEMDKGMRLTMTHLTYPINQSVAVTSHFMAMARYSINDYLDGKLSTEDMVTLCGQIERSAETMETDVNLSPNASKVLKDTTGMILHNLLELSVIKQITPVKFTDEIRSNLAVMEKILFVFFSAYTGGSWYEVLTLLAHERALAFKTLWECVSTDKILECDLLQKLALHTGSYGNKGFGEKDSDEEGPASGGDKTDFPEPANPFLARKAEKK